VLERARLGGVVILAGVIGSVMGGTKMKTMKESVPVERLPGK